MNPTGLAALEDIRRRSYVQFLRGVSINTLRYEAENRFKKVLQAGAGSGGDSDPLLLLIRAELERRGEERVWKTAVSAAAGYAQQATPAVPNTLRER